MAGFLSVIGRSENIDLPDVVSGIPAKIDTGAYRSSIHCTSVKVVTKDGKAVLRVELLGHPASETIFPLDFNEFEKVKVTNSFGDQEERYNVTLRVKLGSKVFKTPFTLADRSNNIFPILAGRTLLSDRYLVDVSRTGVDRATLIQQASSLSTLIIKEDME